MSQMNSSGQLDQNNLPIDPTKPVSLTDFASLGSRRSASLSSSTPFDMRGVKRSDITGDIFATSDPQYEAAAEQSGWGLVGKFLTRGLGEVAFGTVEGLSYMGDLEQHANLVRGAETEYTNWLADLMKKGKEAINEGVGGVYMTRAGEDESFGFAQLGDGTWWVKNAPSIASSLSLMIPSAGVARLGGMAGKAIRGSRLFNTLDKGEEAISAFRTIVNSEKASRFGNAMVGGLASRYMENTMEASQAFESTYSQAIAKGMSDEQAKATAGEAAAGTFKWNSMLAAVDIAQHMSLLKGPLSATRKIGLQNKLLKSAGVVGGNAVGEAFEEGYQFVAQEENSKKALGELGPYSFGERMNEYLKDPAMHEAMFLGAMGGAVMSGFSEATGAVNRISGEKMLSQIAAQNKGNIQDARNMKGELFLQSFLAHAAQGKMEDFEKLHSEIAAMSDEELDAQFQGSPEEKKKQIADFRKNGETFTEDLNFLKEKYAEVYDEANLSSDQRHKKLGAIYQQRVNARTKSELAEQLIAIKAEATKEHSAQDVDLTEQTIRLNLLKSKLKALPEQYKEKILTAPIEKAFEQEIAVTEEKIKQLKETGAKSKITSNNEDLIKNISNSLDNYAQEVFLQNRLKQVNTKKGMDDLIAADNELKRSSVREAALSDKATRDVVDGIYREADDVTKKEIEAEYAKRVEEFKPSGNVEADMNEFFRDPLRMTFRLKEIADAHADVDISNVKTIEDVRKLYTENPTFKSVITNQFKKKETPVTKTLSEAQPEPNQIGEVVYTSAGEPTIGSKYARSLSHAMFTEQNNGNFLVYGLIQYTDERGYAKQVTREQIEADGYQLYDSAKGQPRMLLKNGAIVPSNNDVTMMEGFPIAFMEAEDYAVINDPDANIQDLPISFVVVNDDVYGKEPIEGKRIIKMTIQRNGQTITIGKLQGDSVEAKSLRKRIAEAYKDNGQKEVAVNIEGVTVGGRSNGNLNVLMGSNAAPHEVSSDLILSVVLQGKDGSITHEFKGAQPLSIAEGVTLDSKFIGHTFMWMKSPSGTYVPLRLMTKEVKDVPSVLAKVEAAVEGDLKELSGKLKNLIHANIKFENDVIHILDRNNGKEEPRWRVMSSRDEILAELSTRAVMVPVGSINNSDFNIRISKEGYFAPVKLSSTQPFVNTGVRINYGVSNASSPAVPVVESEVTTFTEDDGKPGVVAAMVDFSNVNRSLEAKKADIERKRQEELKLIPTEEQFVAEMNKKFPSANFRYWDEAIVFAESSINKDRIKDTQRAYLAKYRDNAIDKINAKYDAELATLETKKESTQKPKSGRTRTKRSVDEDSIFRVENNFITYEKWNAEKELSWFQKTYPNVPISVMDDLSIIHGHGGIKAWGLFKKAAVYIATDAQRGTAYHEAFHAVFNLYFTPKERAAALAYAESKGRLGTIAQEEWLADEFMGYMITGETSKGLIGRIADMFKSLYQMIKMIVEQHMGIEPSFDDMFYRMSKGHYAGRASQVTNETRFKVDSSLNLTEEDEFIRTLNAYLVTEVMSALSEEEEYSYLKGLRGIEAIQAIKKNAKSNKDFGRIMTDAYAAAFEFMEADMQDAINDGVNENIVDLIRRRIDTFGKLNENGDIELNRPFVQRAAFRLNNYGITVVKESSKIELSEEEVSDYEEKETKEDWTDSTFRDNYDKIPSRLRSMLFTIPVRRYVKDRTTGKREVKIGRDNTGLYDRYEDGRILYNILKREISGSRDADHMMEKLDELAEKQPSFIGIQEAIERNPTLKTDLWKTVGQQIRIKIISNAIGRKESDTDGSFVHNQKGVVKMLIEDSKYIYSTTDKPNKQSVEAKIKYFQELKSTRFSDPSTAVEKVPADRMPNAEEIQQIIGAFDWLGIHNINGSSIEDMLLDDHMFKANGKDGANTVQGLLNMSNAITNIVAILNVVKDGRNPYESASNTVEARAISKLINSVSKYAPSIVADNARINDKTISSYIDNKGAFLHLSRLLNDKKYKQDKQKDPFVANSPLLNSFDQFTFTDIENGALSLSMIGVLKTPGKSQETTYGQLDSKLREIISMREWVGAGVDNNNYTRYIMPILSNAEHNMYFEYKKLSMQESVDHLVGIAYQEYSRMQNIKAIVGEHQDVHKKFLDEWLKGNNPDHPVELKDIPMNLLLNGTTFQTVPELNSSIKYSDVDTYDTIDSFKNAIKKGERLEDRIADILNNRIEKEINALLEENILIRNNKTSSLEFSDPTLMKGKFAEILKKDNLEKYIANQIVMNTQLFTLFGGDTAFYKRVQARDENKVAIGYKDGKDPFSFEGGQDLADSTKRIKQIWSPSVKLDDTAQHTMRNGEVLTVNKNYRSYHLSDVETASSKELLYHVAEAYKRIGKIQEQIDKDIKGFKKNNLTDAFSVIDPFRAREIEIGSSQWSQDKDDALERMINGEPYDIEDGSLFTAYKPFNFRLTTINRNGQHLVVPQQEKMAQFILHPDHAAGNPILEKVMNLMGYTFKKNGTWEYKQPDEYVDVIFNSALKVGERNVASSIDDIIADPESYEVIKPNSEYGIQLATPEHYIDTDILLGTQVKRHIQSDIKNEQDYIFNNKVISGKNLKRIIHDAYADNIRLSYEAVKAVYTKDGVFDARKFIKEIQLQMRNDLTSEEIVSQLDVFENADGTYSTRSPLWYPQFSYDIEKAINALYKKHITKQKIKGAALYNSSGYGLSDKNRPQVVFRPDGSIDYFEVLIPPHNKKLFERFYNADTKEFDMDAIEKHNPDLLKAIMYRIPTEDKYSIFHVKIKGFLPPMSGAQVIFPDEITTIAGLDFDIDKMYGMFYTFNKDLTTNRESGKAKNDNLIMDASFAVMQHPMTTGIQMTPGGFEDTKAAVKDIRSWRESNRRVKHNIGSPSYQRDTHDRMTVGNSLIGVFANHDANQAVLGHFSIGIDRPHQITLDGVNYFNVIAPHAEENGYQKRALNALRTLLAGAVDHAKDPLAGEFNTSMDTADAIAIMTRLAHTQNGIIQDVIDIKTVEYFFSSPVFLEFNNRMKRSFGGADNKNTIINEMLNALEKDISMKYRNESESIDKESIMKIPMNKETFRSRLGMIGADNAIENLHERAAYDYKTLLIFQNLNAISFEMADLMSQMRPDAQKNSAGPTHGDNIRMKSEHDRILGTKEDIKNRFVNFKILKGVSTIFETLPWIENTYEYSIEESLNITEQVVYGDDWSRTNDGMFKHLRDRMQALKDSKRMIPVEAINKIDRMLMTLYASSFEPFNHKYRKDIINNFPNKLIAFRKTKEGQKYATLLNRFVNDRDGFRFDNTLLDEHITLYNALVRQMYNSSNEATRKIAEDLIKYAFFTTGFVFNHKSFYPIIPIDVMNNMMDADGNSFITIFERLLKTSSAMQYDEATTDAVMRQIMQNADVKWNFVPMIKNVTLKDGVLSIDSETKEAMNIKSSYFKAYIDGEMKHFENVKIPDHISDKFVYAPLPMNGSSATAINLSWEHVEKGLPYEPKKVVFVAPATQPSQRIVQSEANTAEQNVKLKEQNIFTVKPIQAVDKKATIKASIATQYIGFAEGIVGSSTESYRQQAGKYANTGNYSSNDVIFVSIGGKRGSETIRKEQQDKTIKEALKAIEAGATLITDNKAYVESSDYNEGEKRLAKNLEAKGYNYSEQTIDGQVLGVWNKQQSDIVEQNNNIVFTVNTTTNVAQTVEQFFLANHDIINEVGDLNLMFATRLNEVKRFNMNNLNDVKGYLNNNPSVVKEMLKRKC